MPSLQPILGTEDMVSKQYGNVGSLRHSPKNPGACSLHFPIPRRIAGLLLSELRSLMVPVFLSTGQPPCCTCWTNHSETESADHHMGVSPQLWG